MTKNTQQSTNLFLCPDFTRCPKKVTSPLLVSSAKPRLKYLINMQRLQPNFSFQVIVWEPLKDAASLRWEIYNLFIES